MRRALIACGGTGGHLAPGIALAEELGSRGWNCQLLISGKQVDSRLVQKYTQFEYQAIAGRGLSWSPIRLFQFLSDLLAGYRTCVRIIKSTSPDVVVGFGGFISASALLAGSRNRIPVAIHEANQIPGRVTRLASRFADRVYLPEGVTVNGSRELSIRHVGMPLRKEFERLSRVEAKRKMGFDTDKKLLLVFGGSQGAQSLNEWALEFKGSLKEKEIQLACLTGMLGGYADQDLDESEATDSVKSSFIEFSDQMAILLSAADLAISRAGAGSIAELIRCRVPSILIPYPYSADNHQYFNAKQFEEQGGGFLLSQEEMGKLYEMALDLLGNDSALEKIAAQMESMDCPNAQVEMALDLERLIANGSAVTVS